MRRIERGEQAEMRTTENGDVDAAEAPGAEREEEGKLSTPRIGSTTPCASATGTSGIVSPPRPETQDPQTTRPPLPTANLREAFPSESEEGLSDHANLPDKASSSTRNVRVPGSHGPSLAHLGNGQVGAEGAHIDPDESEFPTATHASASGPGPSQLKRRAEDDDLVSPRADVIKFKF